MSLAAGVIKILRLTRSFIICVVRQAQTDGRSDPNLTGL